MQEKIGRPPIFTRYAEDLTGCGWHVQTVDATRDIRQARIYGQAYGARIIIKALAVRGVDDPSLVKWPRIKRKLWARVTDAPWYKLPSITALMTFAHFPLLETLEEYGEPCDSPVPKRTSPCQCGKLSLWSEQEAQEIITRAKIKASLRGDQRRRESRAYPCPYDPARLHLTSKR